MDKNYWIGRKRDAMAMARGASSSEERLEYYELAGRCSISAADCPPHLMVRKRPPGEPARATLHLPEWGSARPGSIYSEMPIDPVALRAPPQGETE